DKLASPSEDENSLNVLSVNYHYKELFREYVHNTEQKALTIPPKKLSDAMTYLWTGNKNAALTIFRHLDSASVSYGLLGDYPETAWVLDYATLERIHYLLVAGFDVYGNIAHQINTRLFMDFLRTQGEDYFLAFLPVDARKKIRERWYQGIRESDEDNTDALLWLDKELVTGYQTEYPQQELYQSMIKHLGDASGNGDFINRCNNNDCTRPVDKNSLRADRAMKKATQMDGTIVQFLPDLAFVRVRMGEEAEIDRAYTMIYNKAYKSVSSLLQTEKIEEGRDYHLDTQTIVPWLEGSFPNFFYVVELNDIENFVETYNTISNRQEYEKFIVRYGIRRTHEDFWLHYDWFNQQSLREQPVKAGIFDLSRYQNR
ncbi:MAG: fatty acid cis/trans isomerase, partial [Thiomicrorhabdus sp.]|nr:fatty acid cis/trans isomerase [Thiomicrorhabdus sp.]